MHILIRSMLLVLMLTFSQYGNSQSTEVQNVLDQIVKTYGGEKNLRKLDSMVQEWTLFAKMGNRHGTDTRRLRLPGQLRVDLNYPGKSETRILNGDNAYVLFDGSPAGEVSTHQKGAMRLQLMRLYSPLVLRDKAESIVLKEEGGLLALTLVEQGMHVHYLVNRENWRIEKVAGSLIMNAGEIQFLTEYSDFAVVEGVLVHRRENKFAGGMNTAVLKLEQITFDAQLDEDLFRP